MQLLRYEIIHEPFKCTCCNGNYKKAYDIICFNADKKIVKKLCYYCYAVHKKLNKF